MVRNYLVKVQDIFGLKKHTLTLTIHINSIYVRDVYLNEGDWEVHPVSIRSVSQLECEYEPIKGENNDR